ncbi:MAG: hypothetical protein QXN87_02695 [Candidatus Bathyarchaeia archaeon]
MWKEVNKTLAKIFTCYIGAIQLIDTMEIMCISSPLFKYRGDVAGIYTPPHRGDFSRKTPLFLLTATKRID